MEVPVMVDVMDVVPAGEDASADVYSVRYPGMATWATVKFEDGQMSSFILPGVLTREQVSAELVGEGFKVHGFDRPVQVAGVVVLPPGCR